MQIAEDGIGTNQFLRLHHATSNVLYIIQSYLYIYINQSNMTPKYMLIFIFQYIIVEYIIY